MTGPSRKHVSALDGLRGVAILLVFLFHYAGGGKSSSLLIRALSAVKESGWLGVDLFFVLSGFLITGILFDTKQSPHYFKTFYIRRALRIFPIFYTSLAAVFLLSPWIGANWRLGHLAYVFYGANIAAWIDPTLNGPSPWTPLYHIWSLALEEQFYFLWPFVVWKIDRPGTLSRICLGMAAASAILRAIAAHYSLGLAYSQLPFRLDGFAMGAIVAVGIRSGQAARLKRLSGWLLVAGGTGLIAVALATKTFLQWTLPMATIGVTCSTVMFTGILIQTLQPGYLSQRFMNQQWLRFFGKYSYGLYLYHVLLLPSVFWLVPFFQAAVQSTALAQLAWFSTALCLNIAMAVASFHLFEQRFLRLKRHFEYGTPERPLRMESDSAADHRLAASR